jgi:predicted N-acetyltransferase YhbS
LVQPTDYSASIHVRQGLPADWETILRLSEACFCQSPGAFSRQWPHSYFGPEAARNCVVCEKQGKIIGAINQVPIVIRIGNARLRVTGLCGVCTQPEERGKGVLRSLMGASLHQQQARASAAILWGARDLYYRFGFETAGLSHYVALHRKMVGEHPGVPLRRLTPSDARSVLDLARRMHSRVVRSQSWQERLLGSQRCEVYGNAQGALSAYLVYVQKAPLRERVIEAIGKPQVLAGLLARFLEMRDAVEVKTWFPPGSEVGSTLAQKAEKTFGPGVEALCATNMCILDFPRLLRCLSHPLAENLKRCGIKETLMVKCEPGPKALVLRVDEEGLEVREAEDSGLADLALDRTRWVRLLFPPPGNDLMDADIEQGLRDAFRLPLVYPPWDIV